MGMTKAIQERVLAAANLTCPKTRFISVRYGNVLASRGSVVPLFHEQIRSGGPVTVTTKEMTRFLLGMEEAVDTIFAAVRDAKRGETYVPRLRSARMIDLARALIGDRPIEIEIVGIRPGEKVHEIMISEEERYRTVDRGNYYAIQPILPELRSADDRPADLPGEYSSATQLMDYDELCALLKAKRLRVEDTHLNEVELLR
jgi:UDP-glucose 4-epimerase